ncbi:MAG: hypothetical protein QOE63_1669 [Acidimicrobiaceae bacterium]|jgi:uncharacterized protein with FMN-binding domain
MRRAIPVIAATAGSLALLATFHTTPAGVSLVATSPSPSTETPTTTANGATAPAGPSTAAPPRSVDGPVVSTHYGDVQVRITLQGPKITDVQALQLPSDRSRSREISQAAGPLLRTEVLKAQSANIDGVSGASYTSDGYARSLQGALDKAGH